MIIISHTFIIQQNSMDSLIDNYTIATDDQFTELSKAINSVDQNGDRSDLSQILSL